MHMHIFFLLSYTLLGDDMDKEANHVVSITERKNIVLNGVKKIESFDNEEFLLETIMGYVVIKGSTLEILKLDTFQGTVSIKGKIDSLTYMEKTKKEREESFLGKLFK